MLSIVTTKEAIRWNKIVKSFRNWDIYYLCEYASLFELHGDGTPLLIYFERGAERFCYVVMLRDIASDQSFKGILESEKFKDLETPYGYGGPLCDSAIVSIEAQLEFRKEIREYAAEMGIVSQFIRFHPLLSNHECMPSVFETRYLHQTVAVDTSSLALITDNMDSKNRNMVRKAIRNNVRIVQRPITDYKDFVSIYTETMIKDEAAEYYFFKEDYFGEQVNLKDNAAIFYALKDELPIAGAIMYYNDRFMHYHLSGVRTDYRKLAPSNLLLYEAACWANKNGIIRFHLGGGIVEDDNLFGFKKQFNKKGWLPFYIGRTVFSDEIYQYLIELRKATDPDFDPENSRMIQYRV